jgi:hypothetical protein
MEKREFIHNFKEHGALQNKKHTTNDGSVFLLKYINYLRAFVR